MMLEKNRILAINSRKLKLAGLMPRYINCGNKTTSITKEMVARVPFSSLHRTHSDYMLDVDKALELSLNDIEIPNELIERISKTNRELGILNI